MSDTKVSGASGSKSVGGKKIDPRIKNLVIFVLFNIVVPSALLYAVVKVFNVTDYVWLLGVAVILVAVWRILLTFYRRVILQPKKPLEYGQWAIVTGDESSHTHDTHLQQQTVLSCC